MIWNFCIRRPVLTIVVFLVAAIFGIYGLIQMPVQENPDIDFPIVSVNVVLPGAAPEIIESEIIDPLEGEINTIEGLRQLTSSSRSQTGMIIAEFELWRDIDVATQDVRDAVERARRMLPDEAEAPIVRKLDMGAQAIMWLTLTGDERWDEVRLTDYAENTIKTQVETLRGVGQIQVGGRRLYAVRITLDPERLAAHQLSVQDVVRSIQANNVDIPSGRIEGSQREFLIQVKGQFDSAEPFNDIVIAYRNDAPVRLGDVGEAADGIENDRQLARFAGQPTVGLGVVKQSDANTVELAKLLHERMTELAQDFPPGLEYHVAMDSSEYVEESIRDLATTILMATGLVVLVVMAFLRSWRGTIITAIAIPTSLLIGLAIINLLGFSINTLSMLGMILVIGIVIDDAIIVLERCYLHMEKGAEAKPAARVGTTEVAFPAIANSLALGAVFLPVAFMGGIIGRFFLEFGLTVAVTVFASTFVALTLTPVLCSRLLRHNGNTGPVVTKTERLFELLERGYHFLLRGAFAHRGQTVLAGIVVFILGVVIVIALPKEFAPMEDRSNFMVIFETPRGSALGETDKLAQQIEQILADMPEVQHQFLVVGMGQGGPGEPNRGMAFVRLVDRDQRELHQEQVMQQLRGKLGELTAGRAFVSEIGIAGAAGGSPIEVVIKHPEIETLAQQQEDVIRWMNDRPELFVGVRTNLELNNPELSIDIHREKATQLGISVADISNTLRHFFGSPTISSIERDARRYDVITDIKGRGELTPDILQSLYVRGSGGELVALDNIVTVTEAIGPAEIHRFNRMRSATISADTPPGVTLGTAVEKLEDYLEVNMPPGADYELAGMSQVFEESFYYLTLAVVMSIVFIYLVLAAQFESFLHPFTIMMSLPLATVGAFGGLWVAGETLNIYAFIGLIMLLGLVAKNAILLVDYTNVLMGRGMNMLDAAQEAAKVRFRPVIMTAISTILGMMPIALAFGAGGEARAPLGIAVAGGLAVSTFLTLLIIPVVYTLVDQLKQKFLGWLRGESPVRNETGEETA
ncbi:efflux RND transporter permease subunit [Desulfurispira natronophila]|uniref:Hydrophobe/amphiphile efflux-1 (HAE1) family protein n=1 Tax=Desulfurispira natronophila TaxID=682562 RepID=A0A7W7Y3X3_9BACT|nr:hydrophobe/amphiphile efflux-1 (HAE1) family protein [Desulfurispira natronophila]